MEAVFTAKRVEAIKKASAKKVKKALIIELPRRKEIIHTIDAHQLFLSEVNRWNGCGKNRRTPRY